MLWWWKDVQEVGEAFTLPEGLFVHGEAREATSAYTSTSEVFMGKNMKSMVVVVTCWLWTLRNSVVSITVNQVRGQKRSAYCRIQEMVLFLGEKKVLRVAESECRMSVKLPFLKEMGLDVSFWWSVTCFQPQVALRFLSIPRPAAGMGEKNGRQSS